MQIRFLGTASSFGVPEIGCRCPVCMSDDPRDRRTRCSLWVRHGGHSLVVDTTPDFRAQCLAQGVERIDAVLMTHDHADHVMGMDDLRRFNRIQQGDIPVYLPERMREWFFRVFGYAMEEPPPGITLPRYELHRVTDEPFVFGDLRVVPVRVNHGRGDITGYVFEADGVRVAYLTDCKFVREESLPAVLDADVAILDALWTRDWSHPGHPNLTEALAMAEELRARKVYLTHMTHYMGLHARTEETLPANVRLGYDGLEFSVP